MANSRKLGFAGALLAALITAIALAVPASAATVNYVALGDSYSSGVGAGDYISSSGSCERSPNAYSAKWAEAHSPASYTSVACSGATTSDIINNQVNALSSATTLVSITVGGNDVGFADTMQTCVLHSTDDCLNALHAGEQKASTELPGKLDAAYSAIRAHAPNAKVVVLDYPHFYKLGVWYCVGLAEKSRQEIDHGIDMLADIVSAAADRAGFTFADVRGNFSGHELCSGDKWLHAVNVTEITESYHPMASGHSQGYLPAFSNAAA